MLVLVNSQVLFVDSVIRVVINEHTLLYSPLLCVFLCQVTTLSVNTLCVTLSDIIVEEKLDLLCLVETWHKLADGFVFNELIPTGYRLFDVP